MDGAYHPIWAAFPSNPTLGSKAVARRPHRMGLAPAAGGPDRGNSELRETKTSGCLRPMRHTSRSLLLATGFGVGLLPVHSPLLRESRLVSFPPLSDMLKFSGSSRPSRGRRLLSLLSFRKRGISIRPSWRRPERETRREREGAPTRVDAAAFLRDEAVPVAAARGAAVDRRRTPSYRQRARRAGGACVGSPFSLSFPAAFGQTPPAPPPRCFFTRSKRERLRGLPAGDEGGGRRSGSRSSSLSCDVPVPTAPRTERARGRRDVVSLTGKTCDVPPLDRTWPRDKGSRSRNVRSRCRCSLSPAIRISSRGWPRSSSTDEPSDPPSRV